MHGNLNEWVEDIYHTSYKRAPTDGSAWTISEGDNTRVKRGGDWGSAPKYVRSASRTENISDLRNFVIGFRVARTLD